MKNLKKQLIVSGATLAAALTLGATATTSVHASTITYDDMEAQWAKMAPKYDDQGRRLNLVGADQAGDPTAHKLINQVNAGVPGAWVDTIYMNDNSQPGSQAGSASNSTTSNASSSNTANSNSGYNSVLGGYEDGNSSQTNVAKNSSANNGVQYVATKNNSGMTSLPQTGNDNSEAVAATGAGLALASVASMFGFGYMKKRA